MNPEADKTAASGLSATDMPAFDCPSRVTPDLLERCIGLRHCELREACVHLGLHRHGTQCPHLVRIDREDKLSD
jgi:hypothetical protein